LRGTNIEPDYANPNPQPGAQLLVPQALWQTYCDTFPQTMRSAIIGY
jgi:hypothetical protein